MRTNHCSSAPRAVALLRGASNDLPQLSASCHCRSALGHDIGHPGVTNEFLISMRSFTSILFNETAVLENYHSLLFLDLLKNPDLDILKMLPPEAVQKARQRIIGAILATDRALDMKLLDLLMELRNKNDKVPVPAALLDPSIRDACLIHAGKRATAE